MITVISVINNRVSTANFLEGELATLEGYFAEKDSVNTSISQADVAWHLDHILKTINTVSKDLIRSNPERYEPQFNVQRSLVHTLGIFPRGVAQAPQRVTPPNVVRLDSLRQELAMARENLNTISTLQEKAYFAHPVFDHMDRDQARRFLQIHTRHHLSIIQDILGE